METMWKKEYEQVVHDFLTKKDQKRLFFWVDAQGIKVDTSNPPRYYEVKFENEDDYQVAFFLKIKDGEVQFKNIEESIIASNIEGDPLDDLKRKIETILPKFRAEKWPEAMKKDFYGQLQTFMAGLFEAYQASRGEAELYIPDEDLNDITQAANDKDLVQQLDSSVIRWTRQIKNEVYNQDSQQERENSRPSEEIEHWKNRKKKLTRIKEQLDKNPQLQKIKKVLKAAESPHLAKFEDEGKRIDERTAEAENNVKYLEILTESFKKLEAAHPREVPAILPEMLQRIRIIWELSEYYGHPDKMGSLLTKISNEIIRRCKSTINVDDLLEGDVEKCIHDLDESIDCGNQWKEEFEKMQRLINTYSKKKGFEFGKAGTKDRNDSIFAQVEAFKQRCNELKEIGQCQLQFAMKGKGVVIPEFPGSKGRDISNNLEELKRQFNKHLDTKIKEIRKSMLDLNNQKWHDNITSFKSAMKDLDTMLIHIISNAASSICTVTEAAELVENFDYLARRETVREGIYTKIVPEHVYQFFKAEVKEIERIFEHWTVVCLQPAESRYYFPLPHPFCAGSALFERALVTRLDHAYRGLDMLFFVKNQGSDRDQCINAYQSLKKRLENHIKGDLYMKWKEKYLKGLRRDYEKEDLEMKLEQPVIVEQSRNEHDSKRRFALRLECNFDKDLQGLYAEVKYWEKLQYSETAIITPIMKIYKDRDDMRILRENVMLAVRDYNLIIQRLESDEKKLFAQHLTELYAKIMRNMDKYKWSTLQNQKFFQTVRDWRTYCEAVYNLVENYKKNISIIDSQLRQIEDSVMLEIDKNKAHPFTDFVTKQQAVIEKYAKNFRNSFETIRKAISDIYDPEFLHAGEDIQKYFNQVVLSKYDTLLLEKLKRTVSRSLQELLVALGTDEKDDTCQFIRIEQDLVIEDQGISITFSPKIEELLDEFEKIFKNIKSAGAVIPRLAKKFREDRDEMMEKFEKRRKQLEEEKAKTGKAIEDRKTVLEIVERADGRPNRGLPPIDPKLAAAYDEILSLDNEVLGKIKKAVEPIKQAMDMLIKRFKTHSARCEKPLTDEAKVKAYHTKSKRGGEIAGDFWERVYSDLEEKGIKRAIEDLIMNTTSNLKRQFVEFDSGKLREKLTDLKTNVKNIRLKIIYEHERKEMQDLLYKTFPKTIEKLMTQPSTPEELKDILLSREKINIEDISKQITSIQKAFQNLKGQDFTLPPADQQDEAKLPTEFEKFKSNLSEADNEINKNKKLLKDIMLRDLETFANELELLSSDYDKQAPKTIDKNDVANVANAKRVIAEYKEKLKEKERAREEHKSGIELFKIEEMTYPKITYLKKELQLQTMFWELKEQWDEESAKMDIMQFRKLNIEAMTACVMDYLDKLEKLPNEIRDWPGYTTLSKDIILVRDVLPLVKEISTKAMIFRHWEKVYAELKCEEFNPDGDFTFKKIKELHLEKHADFIHALNEEARRDLELDQTLTQIKERWSKLKLKIEHDTTTGYYKMHYYDAILDVLEKDLNKLSEMKTSESFQAFQVDIESWESDLIKVSETLEILWQVQKQWVRQEAIFNGQGSLSKQLGEKGDFDVVHKRFMQQMERIYKDQNVKKACLEKNFDKILIDLNKKLENIDHVLTHFLDSKRGFFPRFYFLSNDELLEIVGCAYNINPVKKHLKKIFEGIADVTTNQIKGGITEILKISSLEKEELTLIKKVEVNKNSGVEDWLKDLKESVEATLMKELNDFPRFTAREKDSHKKLETFLKNYPGQIIIAGIQSEWTDDIEYYLKTAKEEISKALDLYDKQSVPFLAELLKSNKIPKDRLKIQQLLTVMLHLRDVIYDLKTKQVSSVNSFEWIKRLRFLRKTPTSAQAVVRQGFAEISYDYEYQGNNGRLVVTPLTERCYLVLTTAIFLRRGGAPHGPAGTGKTETVKDLAKACGKYIVVFNCSEGLSASSLFRMFSGLVGCGSWGCFDEFNRIEVEVLSVAAHQISSILDAIRMQQKSVDLVGTVALNPGCALFITYNPGYSGRSELPDNLKTLFRPIAMVIPDAEAIAENLFLSEGFTTKVVKQEKGEKIYKELAKKVVSMYGILQRQMSKQAHYDFGLRAIISTIKYAGEYRQRINEKEIDSERLRDIVYKALDDLISPQLVAEDNEIFEASLGEMFPQKVPTQDNEELIIAIEQLIDESKLTHNNFLKQKMLQLYSLMRIRHGNMVVGQTLSGKTTCWQILAKALTLLKTKKSENFNAVKWHSINPKAVSIDELFGYNKAREWQPGVIPTILKTAVDEAVTDGKERWIVIDGPVDPKWIESLNSLLDDNKCLTIGNGERISLNSLVKILFEVEHLATASPATVSRCGMIYSENSDLGYVESWIEQKNEQDKTFTKYLVDKYLAKFVDAKRKLCREPIPTSEESAIINLCKLFDAIIPKKKGKEDVLDDYAKVMERCFIYSLAWSIGGSVDESSRKELDQVLRDIDATHCPSLSVSGTIYDFFVSIEKGGEWTLWEDKVPQNVKFDPNTSYNELVIDTVDSVRNRELVEVLIRGRNNVLTIGNVGVGKTVLINSLIKILGSEAYHSFSILFSGNTSAGKVQDIIESKFESHSRGRLFQPRNRTAICFADDLNMPKKDEFGSQAPLELLRQWMDYGGWYDREKIVFKEIVGLLLIGAMAPRSGGRNEIPTRALAKMHILNFITPAEKQIIRIFSKIAEHKLQTFEDEEIKKMPDDLATSTYTLYHTISQIFLPTPSKCHYTFNLRDISKVFQGLQNANKTFYETKETVLCLWVHECISVFNDRLANNDDRKQFKDIMANELAKFGMSFDDIQTKYKGDLLFVDFLHDKQVYKDVKNFDELKTYLENKLHQYNTTANLSIVLFKDAVYNLCKIYRVLKMSRCHGLLLGVGGSGRHSLARLAAVVANFELETPEMTRKFDFNTFRGNVKNVFRKAGLERKQTVFLLSENELMGDPFLEDLSCMISTGDVPGLYNSEELRTIRDAMSELLKKELKDSSISMMASQQQLQELQEQSYAKFTTLVANNLHVMICFSPVGSKFRNSCRDYPALLNATTGIYFLGWPEYALSEVANKFVSDLALPEKQQKSVAGTIAFMHASAIEVAEKMKSEKKRPFYLTPTHYMDLMKGYQRIKEEKGKELDQIKAKLTNGLLKFKETEKRADAMNTESSVKKQKNLEKVRKGEEMTQLLTAHYKDIAKQEADIKAKQLVQDRQKEEAEALLKAADEELAKAEPKLQEAQKALDELKPADITEVKGYKSPKPEVLVVLEAVMVIMGKPPTWGAAVKEMANPHFIKSVKEYEVSKLTDSQLKELEGYTKKSEFKFERIKKVSNAAASFSKWVLAIEDVAKAIRSIEPKKRKRESALEAIRKSAEELAGLEAEKKKVADVINDLSAQKKKVEDEREELRKEIEELEVKIDRAEQLIKNLTDFCQRWEKELENIKDREGKLPGDALVSAAFLSYCGPMNKEYRDELMTMWIAKVKENAISMSSTYDFCYFMVGEPTIREWRMKGLPTDKFSEQNAVIITKTDRWPLVIDPQDQISHWLKEIEAKPEDRFKQLTRRAPKFFLMLETAVIDGKAVMIPDVGEELDVEMDNLLKKSFIKAGGDNKRIKIQREIKYNPAFKLYMTTKLNNPHYTPEIYTKVTIVNFALTEQALTDQLLNTLFEIEEKDLSKKKDTNARNIDKGKREVIEKEDEILKLLNESTASLLDNDILVNTMLNTKEHYEKNNEEIVSLEQNMKKIEETRGKYRSCAKEGAILFFVMNDLSHIDPMYQFSLKSYKALFKDSISKSSGTTVFGSFEQKLEKMKDALRSVVYKKTCDTLFEKHKLLLAFLICYRLKMTDVDQELWSFFLKGGIVLNRKEQPQNINAEWLPPSSWDNVTELEKIPTFAGIVSSLQLNSLEWSKWYMHPQPELQNLPSEWDSKCDDDLKKLAIIRSLRPDRVTFVVKERIIKKYWPGYKDASSEPVSLREVMESTKVNKPLLCILGPGVDPVESLTALAKEKIKDKPLLKVSLGQEQAGVVTKALEEGIKKDTWIYFANCHYAISTIQDLTEQLAHKIARKDAPADKKDEPKNFRVILSSISHPKFPISLLRSCEKITIEPLTGIKANMCRLYQSLGVRSEFTNPTEKENYARAVFSLTFYHCVLLERRRFRTLGWNKIYNFNESDIFACENLLLKTLKHSSTDLTTIQELITDALYGGRVTDDNDRDLLKVYTKEFFSDAIFTKDWRPVKLKDDIIKYEYPPEQQVMKSEDDKRKFLPSEFLAHISATFPAEDPPEVFGQHLNAEISTQIADTNLLLSSMLIMQPRMGEMGATGGDDEVMKIAENVLEKDIIPEYIDMEGVRFRLRSDNSPLNYVLNQEAIRYNRLINIVRSSLTDLMRCMKGEIVMTNQMEEIYNSLYENKVPQIWLFAYPSIKPFGVWLTDFKVRVTFFSNWVKQGMPSPFLMSAFTSPLSFITALIQKYARKKKIPNLNDIEMVHEFLSERVAVGSPEDGAYVKGIYIEGAYFDETRQLLLDPLPMKFTHQMPVIHFKPKLKKSGAKEKEKDLYTNVYNCPCYYYPVRGEANSYLFSIGLNCGERNAAIWLKRGTALLLSLEQ